MAPSAARARAGIGPFLAVAALSSGMVVALGWLLLEQDRKLEHVRIEERQAQAADRFAAKVQPALADSASQDTRTAFLPDTLFIAIAGDKMSAAGALLYYPHDPSRLREAAAAHFADGEHLEYVIGNLAGAERFYSGLADAADPAVRAGGLGRLGRVQRKRRDYAAAIGSYDRITDAFETVAIEGFAATLYARLGRAGALQQAARRDALEAEARELWSDLQTGRWKLSASEYAARKQEVEQWLGVSVTEESDRRAVAEAAGWLWQNRRSLTTPGYQRLALPGSEVIAAWTPAGTAIRAAVAGPQHMSTLLTDVRTEASSRRATLAAALVGVALVLLVGWYLILRSIARERRAVELQSDFISTVSHEFRSPLTSMAHLTEMLDAGRMPDESQRATYRMLLRDTHRLRRLVEDLLDFRRFETGPAALRLEPVNVRDLVTATAADFQAHGAPPGYAIDIRIPDEPVMLAADRDALTRAIWNLLDNAVKYSPHCHTVWLTVTRDPGRMAITVRDQGLGIPADEQQRVFERFSRGAQARALRIKGTGIGLAIVRHIIRAHGGDVSLTSEPGRGSTFTLLLPDATEGGS